MKNNINPLNLIMGTLNEEQNNYNFKPLNFDDFIGQNELKKKLEIYSKAAKLRNEALDHIILFGPPGLGKTTLAQIIAKIMNVDIKISSGPVLEKTGDLVAILSSLKEKDIFFIDEIHRLKSKIEEVLYSAMEQFKVDIIVGQGPGAKIINLPLKPFTLIGTTTKTGSISAPLRSRFGIIENIEFYSVEELQKIIILNAKYLKINIDLNSALEIAKRSRGTPRIAKKLFLRVRDFAQVENKEIISEELVFFTMNSLGILENGFTKIDTKYLKNLLFNFNGGPVGIETLAAIIGEDSETLEMVYEPYLIQQGFIEKTSKGRKIIQGKIFYLKKLLNF